MANQVGNRDQQLDVAPYVVIPAGFTVGVVASRILHSCQWVFQDLCWYNACADVALKKAKFLTDEGWKKCKLLEDIFFQTGGNYTKNTPMACDTTLAEIRKTRAEDLDMCITLSSKVALEQHSLCLAYTDVDNLVANHCIKIVVASAVLNYHADKRPNENSAMKAYNVVTGGLLLFVGSLNSSTGLSDEDTNTLIMASGACLLAKGVIPRRQLNNFCSRVTRTVVTTVSNAFSAIADEFRGLRPFFMRW